MDNQNNTIELNNVPVHTLYSHPLAKAFLNKVYAWMAVSLLITAGIAGYTASNEECLIWVANNSLWLCLATLGIVLVMSFCVKLLTSGALAVLLLLYSGITGLLFGPLFIIYTSESLALTFGCTAGTFGIMSLYGAVTKSDLSPWGRALFMGLIGLIVALIVNYFWGNGTFDLIISIAGVLIFSLLTAYDTQKLLREGLCAQGEARSKGAVLGALMLYLDFINLFLYLLRFLGDRK